MTTHYKNCSACNSSDLSLQDSSYWGEWAEQTYKCNECGHQEKRYFDFVYHLTPVSLNPTNNESNQEYTQRLQASSQT